MHKIIKKLRFEHGHYSPEIFFLIQLNTKNGVKQTEICLFVCIIAKALH